MWCCKRRGERFIGRRRMLRMSCLLFRISCCLNYWCISQAWTGLAAGRLPGGLASRMAWSVGPVLKMQLQVATAWGGSELGGDKSGRKVSLNAFKITDISLTKRKKKKKRKKKEQPDIDIVVVVYLLSAHSQTQIKDRERCTRVYILVGEEEGVRMWKHARN